jgi:acyl carrier protein
MKFLLEGDVNMDSLEQRLVVVFEDILWGETVPVQERTRLNCSGWDSLAQMNLILSVEQEFQVSLADDEVVDLTSFETTLAILAAKLADAT